MVIRNGKIVWKHGPYCWYFHLGLKHPGWPYREYIKTSLTDAFFWHSKKCRKNVSFYSSKSWILTRNWSEKTLFKQLIVMEDNPKELVASNQQNQNRNSGQYVSCNICQRVFKTNRWLLQHLSFCRKRNRENNINSNTAINDNIAATKDKSDSHDPNGNGDYETYFWNDVRGIVFEKDLTDVYKKIVHWKRNLFMMSIGVARKKYVEEITHLLKLWIQDSPLKSIALKAIYVMPALLLQKPSKNSKSKVHLVSLERRLKLWEEGDISNLLHEGETIQQRMKIS